MLGMEPEPRRPRMLKSPSRRRARPPSAADPGIPRQRMSRPRSASNPTRRDRSIWVTRPPRTSRQSRSAPITSAISLPDRYPMTSPAIGASRDLLRLASAAKPNRWVFTASTTFRSSSTPSWGGTLGERKPPDIPSRGAGFGRK